MATKKTPARVAAKTPTPAEARALGVRFGRLAAQVERRHERECPRTRPEFVVAVEELALWELGESGHAATWYIQNRQGLQRAFVAGARSAARTPRAKRPARTRNPAARKYRTRSYEVSEWNVRAQRWEVLGRVSATSPKYAIEEFMASRPGYSRLHLRADEVQAAPKAGRTRNPDTETDDWRFRLIGDINTWAHGAHEDMGVHRVGRYEPDVGRWAPIAKDAKVPMARLKTAAKPITDKTPYLTAERRLETRNDLARRMTDHLRKASAAAVDRYAYFREDYMIAHEE